MESKASSGRIAAECRHQRITGQFGRKLSESNGPFKMSRARSFVSCSRSGAIAAKVFDKPLSRFSPRRLSAADVICTAMVITRLTTSIISTKAMSVSRLSSIRFLIGKNSHRLYSFFAFRFASSVPVEKTSHDDIKNVDLPFLGGCVQLSQQNEP